MENMNAFSALNIDVIKTIVHYIKWCLHIVDTSIIWVARSWRVIRSYTNPQNSGIPEMGDIFLNT